MNLQERIDVAVSLGEYMLSGDTTWLQARERASRENGWFTPEFIDLAVHQVAHSFLRRDRLESWAASYGLPGTTPAPRNIGIVMAGNIPLVGFHDLLCVFISGHHAVVKASSKDKVLMEHLVAKMADYSGEKWQNAVVFADMLKNCDAYIATGSNNSAGYFEYYFGKYPHIIRRNRTSVAVLNGTESTADLEKLADDVYLYFGLGCRNVTKIYVPTGYDFIPLLNTFKKYDHLADHHKYKNNYDYNLALHILNKQYYMSNNSLLLVENESPFSPISQLNYSFYENYKALIASLLGREDLQCIVASGEVPFGQAQHPSLTEYADGVDTMKFLISLC